MKKKSKKLTSGDVENKIIKLVSQVAGETTIEEVQNLLYKFGEMKYDEGYKCGYDSAYEKYNNDKYY